jgi:DNA-binding GntR family transcriptional regulator
LHTALYTIYHMQTERIVSTLVQAIADHQLKPGAKLGEQRLADHFGVSRTIVRQALFRLAESKLVVLSAGRGASVACPSLEEAKQIFAVRRTLEVQLVKDVTRSATAKDIQKLRRHLKEEQLALRSGKAGERIRLLADFHVIMAECSGNKVLSALLFELSSRCALITMLYQSGSAAQHSHDEHGRMIDAIEAGEAKLAAKLMEEHLRGVEAALDLDLAKEDLAPSRSLAKALQ